MDSGWSETNTTSQHAKSFHMLAATAQGILLILLSLVDSPKVPDVTSKRYAGNCRTVVTRT